MAADKIPQLVESSLKNEGKRTVALSKFAKGAFAPPHYHTDYTETFEVIEGGMTVNLAPDMDPQHLAPTVLVPGKPVTIPILTLHSFVVTEDNTRVKITFDPGSLGWEKVISIMSGTLKDGVFHKLISPEAPSHPAWLAILGQFTNTIFVGEALDRVEAYRSKNSAEIAALQEDLVQKYANQAALEKAANL